MDDRERHAAALHAVQSGVAAEMEIGGGATSPKHLRTGINAAMSDMAGLAGLLISKGVFTQDEYFAALADSMEAEQRRYEAHLSKRLGKPVTLA